MTLHYTTLPNTAALLITAVKSYGTDRSSQSHKENYYIYELNHFRAAMENDYDNKKV